MMKRRASLGLVLATALLMTSACGRRKSDERGQSGAGGPPRITAQEADRGRQACQSYVDQVCDCALKVADLTSECDLARSRPKALEMNLRAAMAEGNATERDRRAIQANARQIAEACIEDAAALVKRGCPISRADLAGGQSRPAAPPAAPESDPTR
jgi:hypothetical protein